LAWRLELQLAGTAGALLRRARAAATERERESESWRNEVGEGEPVRAGLKRELGNVGRRHGRVSRACVRACQRRYAGRTELIGWPPDAEREKGARGANG
jgi:hypothetical protein